MSAATVLRRLADIGVTTEERAGRLVLRPASAVPADLLAEARAEQDEMLRLLASPEPSAVHAADALRHATLILPPASPDQATDEATDRAAVAADEWPSGPPQHPPPPADLVARLAAALAVDRPWQRSSRPAADDYWQSEAMRRLARLDPLSRGLLVMAMEQEAKQWKS